MTTNLKKVVEAYQLFERAMNGDLRAKADVRESLTTSDFPVLLGQGYQRKLLAQYQLIDPVWQQYSVRSLVPNFKKQRLVDILGGARGLSRVAEATEYPTRDFDEKEYDFSVEKYGDRIPLTWEMLINDELGAFRNLDQVLAADARFTEGTVTADALLNAGRTDLNTSFFGTVANDALTADALKAAIEALSSKRNSAGQTIVRPSLKLVVAPGLEFIAKELVAAVEVRTTNGNRTTVMNNPLAGVVDVVVEPNLLRNTNAKANTTWILVPAPGAARPAVVTGFLQGQESPDLRVKNDQGVRPGGGSIGSGEGSFDDDTIQYRVRHVVGAAVIDNQFTFASRGA
ncbi:Mu-like prophage major head subunit gpT family protein [Brachybacterium sp. NBEC-018]|uniref:Mu-like prophage major head subunit gpT family protein n=1 Tax=Brachybacterium sp. NBEC-018 TaxID=2996004 RepID=UPI00217563FD|nr:Mu-like prophage major head subunit gpT family protein [Brachybacterium sp. NBEC-018]UVY83799.1 Mu-like prophage major head subunit gpT family protein [Brachybacterium sp. NBEC-018]